MNTINAHKIITLARYDEKQQGLVDAMLCTWAELDDGAYGFTGYDNTYKALGRLTDEQQTDVAQAILDRRADKAVL